MSATQPFAEMAKKARCISPYKRFLTAAPVAVTGNGCSSSWMLIGKGKARWKPCDPKASDQK